MTRVKLELLWFTIWPSGKNIFYNFQYNLITLWMIAHIYFFYFFGGISAFPYLHKHTCVTCVTFKTSPLVCVTFKTSLKLFKCSVSFLLEIRVLSKGTLTNILCTTLFSNSLWKSGMYIPQKWSIAGLKRSLCVLIVLGIWYLLQDATLLVVCL